MDSVRENLRSQTGRALRGARLVGRAGSTGLGHYNVQHYAETTKGSTEM